MRTIYFFLGVVFVEVISFASAIFLPHDTYYPQVFILLTLGVVVALLFSLITKSQIVETTSKMKEKFAQEREKIIVNAERAKLRTHKEAQKVITKQSIKVNSKANFKVGAAFAGVIGIGALFVMAQMVTAGLLMLSAGAGAMGGYYLRSKREKRQNFIEQKSIKILKKPKQGNR